MSISEKLNEVKTVKYFLEEELSVEVAKWLSENLNEKEIIRIPHLGFRITTEKRET